jgi:hypothetical protein
MMKKLTIRPVLLLVAVFIGFVIYDLASYFIPRKGKVPHVSELQIVCSKAGPGFFSAFTNSFVQTFPFDGPIEWKLILFKDTALFLSGRVDTNRLEQFIVSHPDTAFLWQGSTGEVEGEWPFSNDWPTTTWTNVWFRKQWYFEGYPMSIYGTLDFRTHRAEFWIR